MGFKGSPINYLGGRGAEFRRRNFFFFGDPPNEIFFGNPLNVFFLFSGTLGSFFFSHTSDRFFFFSICIMSPQMINGRPLRSQIVNHFNMARHGD